MEKIKKGTETLTCCYGENPKRNRLFEKEGEPGFQIISDVDLGLDLDGESVFYTNTDTEEVNIENRCIVDIKRAVEIVHEFWVTHQLPKCITWEEL